MKITHTTPRRRSEKLLADGPASVGATAAAGTITLTLRLADATGAAHSVVFAADEWRAIVARAETSLASITTRTGGVALPSSAIERLVNESSPAERAGLTRLCELLESASPAERAGLTRLVHALTIALRSAR